MGYGAVLQEGNRLRALDFGTLTTGKEGSQEQRLTEIGAHVKRYQKPTFTKPAPVDLRHEIATECEVVIEALAD